MDKRFKPLTPGEALEARRTLADELAADPSLPIPAVIRKIRTALRLTIAEYAKLCGVSARTLQDVEREESSPTLATAEKLLRPMGMVVSAVPKRRQAERSFRDTEEKKA
ncbi:helix-turn-helix domain-containing protein [Massilia niabensis]|uniref:Helix-turn-helix domain-containing protein n=1 Tax=Massilia niabensis TaxID=544910 RepID=A0ABW0L3V4_9BURK